MAEAVFRQKVKAAGLDDRILADSAGTGGWHIGQPPHHGTRSILAERGVDAAGLVGRQIERADLDEFDYILTMDESNLSGVRSLGPARGTVRPLLEYGPPSGYTEVPDPFYTGGFEGVYALIDAACDGLLAAIRAEHGL
jgi:protein-tyrosine phosphatase